MAWTGFNEDVEFTVGSNVYLIPIWNLSLNTGPFAREVSEATAIRAFDGRYYQVHQGWRSRVTIEWPEMTPASAQTLYDFIVDLVATGVTTVNFNPSGGDQTIDMILEDPTETLIAHFQNATRRRPASLTLVSQNISAQTPIWITEAEGGDPVMWIDSLTGHWFTSDGSLSVHTDTGLDLSSYSFKNIDFHQRNKKVYGNSLGKIYSWNPDGTNFVEVFDPGLNGADGCCVDSNRDRIAVMAHEINFANRRYREYTLGGTQVYDVEFRIGTASYNLNICHRDNGDGRVLFANTAAIIVVDPYTPDQTGLGPISHLACQDICQDEIGHVAYHLCSPGIFYQSSTVVQTGPPSTNDTFLYTVPNNTDQIDIFNFNSQVWLVGGGGGGEFKVLNNGSSGSWNWAPGTNGVDLLVTRRTIED